MRTAYRLFAFLALVGLCAGQAAAREVDSRGEGNTSFGSSSSQIAAPRVKKDATVPTKYDTSYPVRDYPRAQRPHSI